MQATKRLGESASATGISFFETNGMRQRRGRRHKTQTEPIQVNGWNQVASGRSKRGIAGMKARARYKKNLGPHRFFFYVALPFMLAPGLRRESA
jgi:hypothetical protein